eukprot:scaffold41559_cov36-Phaeocystis_antarctica.AAC.2
MQGLWTKSVQEWLFVDGRVHVRVANWGGGIDTTGFRDTSDQDIGASAEVVRVLHRSVETEDRFG